MTDLDLVKELVKTKNKKGIKEIIGGLNNTTEQIANDCIKVLYEIGEITPELISADISKLYAINF